MAQTNDHLLLLIGSQQGFQKAKGEIALSTELEVVSISCGLSHFVFATADGSVYAHGSNSFGACGFEENKLPKPEANGLLKQPASAFNGEPVVQVSTYNVHNLYRTKSGLVYAAGANWNGQCGTNTAAQYCYTPTLVQPHDGFDADKDPVVQVSAGIYQSLVLTASGKVYGFGANNHSELFFHKTGNILAPVDSQVDKLVSTKIVKVCTGNMASALLTRDGEVVLVGRSYSTPTKLQFRATEIDVGYYAHFVRKAGDGGWMIDSGTQHTETVSKLGDELRQVTKVKSTYGAIAASDTHLYLSGPFGAQATQISDWYKVEINQFLPEYAGDRYKLKQLAWSSSNGYAILKRKKAKGYSAKLLSLVRSERFCDVCLTFFC